MVNTASRPCLIRDQVLKRLLCQAVALLAVLSIVSCGNPADKPAASLSSTVPIAPEQLATLYAAVTSDAVESSAPLDAILARSAKASVADPNWPVLAYLAAELRLKLDDIPGARSDFRRLAMWSVQPDVTGPYKDGKGGSGLAVIALWRWLQTLERQGGSPDEVQEVLATVKALRSTAIYDGMVSSGLLPAMPLLEEDVARRLAHVAAAANRRDALDLFLDFLSLDSTGQLDDVDQKLRARVIDEGLATPERLDLYQLRRQVSRIRVEERKRESAGKLRQLWENQYAPTEVRAEAGYEWSNYNRASDIKKADVINALGSAWELAAGRGFIAERSLYLRGMVQNRGALRDPDAFFADMTRLLERFPNGSLADDALYQVATEHLLGARPDPDMAFSYFEKLRSYKGANDYLDSAFVLAAIGLVDRGKDADLKEADRLLSEYLGKFPSGPFRSRALFWRGRIAEQKGDREAATRHFEQLILEAPFEYYGLRARMHREYGQRATTMALPEANSKTAREVRSAFVDGALETALPGNSPYHARLRAAEESGVYRDTMSIVDAVGKRFRNRLDNVALLDLDRERLIVAAGLLLAWRQDAIAARDSTPSHENQLPLAAFVGHKLGDWPLAIAMADIRTNSAPERLAAMQKDPRFLRTLYPTSEVLRLPASMAESAWAIDGSNALSRSLMDAVIRNESRYYASAISMVGALGLFQVMPATFDGRPDCWEPSADGRKPTAASYLFDPDRNVRFWSCWVAKEFQPRTRNDIVTMLVQHHAGSGNLREWKKSWKGRALERDLELQIECFRFPATRLFVQRVLADIMIIEASGRFETAADQSGKPKT